MKFSDLSKYVDRLEKTSSRLKITEILSDVFKKSDINEIDRVTYLLLGRLKPRYDELVFNVAEKMMIQVISDAYGVDKEKVHKKYKQLGDLGDTAEHYAQKDAKKSDMSVSEVYERLVKVAEDEGEGSVERKVKGLSKLMTDLDSLSNRFVARIPVGKLRLGFSDKTILDALSWMETGDKSRSSQLEKAFFIVPDVGQITKSVKRNGISKTVEIIEPVVGVPLLPMLAARLKSPAEMMEKMKEVSVEPKYDGLRIQIHYKKGKFVKTYTRNLNETSWMFPELVDIGKQLVCDEVVLDVEAIGVDEKTKTLANFQQTMTRRRKHDISETLKNTGIRFYVFDILIKDGISLINKTYLERRQELAKTVKKGDLLQLVNYTITKDENIISSLMKKELSEGLEGVIVKRVDSKYVAGRTGWRWVKMKEPEEQAGKLADTIDCVVMGYSRGRGKRADFGIGHFLAGLLDGEKIKTITKVGTGLTDDQFRELNKRLKKIKSKEKPKRYDVHKDLVPDFWVEPELVVELAADEITKSPNHTAGYALRFPRLVKFRDDKEADQATTVTEIIQLIKLQK
ncbi:ATP-dependent DNA ligase [Candidatus Woesebacteria bacterium]|nr:ATP-dependent DNA ligase [Candidatus Woesebacteria bacterium]